VTRKPVVGEMDDLARIDPLCLSVAAALRWLQKEDPPELSGDDAVGWWLLFEAGCYPPPAVLESMAGRLSRLVSGRGIGEGELYTFTAMVRTLFRVGYPIPNIGAVHDAWSGAMARAWPPGFDSSAITTNHLWLVQTCAEVWPDEARSHVEWLQGLLSSPDPKYIMPANGLLISRDLGIKANPQQVSKATIGIRSVANTALDNRLTDWEMSYLARAAAATGDDDTRRRLVAMLLARQTDGAWDSLSEECVESTSLCGLALVDSAAAELGRLGDPATRSLVIHRCMVLRDKPTWLRGKFRTVRQSSDPNVKGDALESFVETWIGFDPTLRVKEKGMRGGTDEVDLVVEVLGSSRLADDVSPSRFVLVECKNTADAIGARDVRAFRDSLASRRSETCQLGVYISHAGFTKDAQELVREDFGRGKVLVLLSGEEIDRRLAMRQDFSQSIHHIFQDGVLKRP